MSSDEPALPELTPANFINRELSTIEFNRRVLAQAKDKSLPLLERVKFLAIFGNNLDEFYMVRVASYVQKLKLGISRTRPDGYTPSQLLMEIHRQVLELFQEQRATMREIFAELQEQGVIITELSALDAAQREAVRDYFYEEVFPVLTPLAVDHARPFPFISNLSLNLGVYLERETPGDEPNHLEFVRLKVPEMLPRLVSLTRVLKNYAQLDAPPDMFIWLEDIIAHNLDLLFPGMRVVEQHPFRVIRNADIDYEYEREDELLDISTIIEASVRERRFGAVIRLSVPEDISERMLSRLITELDVDPEREVYKIEGALGSSSLFALMSIDRPDLKFPPHVPRLPELIPQQEREIFAAIRKQDILLHHPYDSFTPVEEFFRAAARDPDVLAIKATLYRVGSNSPIVDALMEARYNDKQVAVLVELKARFDEENNLEWARALEHRGVHVTYGVEELPVKTHAKIALVVRREMDGVIRYVHLGTGNYNASTARLYSDLSVFTCNKEIADDASLLFNRLTGYAPAAHYKRLLVAPEFLQPALIQLIDQEIAAAKAGKEARLIFKMNQLEEDIMIQKLYQASQAGVKIDLIIRGLCSLRVGLPGQSENIHVRSIVGRFLEHSRIFYFRNAPRDQQLYLGSADLMRRNLYNRVETVFPVLDTRVRRRVMRILTTCLRDNTSAWIMQPDGSYLHRQPSPDEDIVDSQYIFMHNSAGLDEMPYPELD